MPGFAGVACAVRGACVGLKLCGGSVAAGEAWAELLASTAGTVASRPGRTNGSVPTLALAFGFGWTAEAAVATWAWAAVATRAELGL